MARTRARGHPTIYMFYFLAVLLSVANFRVEEIFYAKSEGSRPEETKRVRMHAVVRVRDQLYLKVVVTLTARDKYV